MERVPIANSGKVPGARDRQAMAKPDGLEEGFFDIRDAVLY
jgi:hypothetical protein